MQQKRFDRAQSWFRSMRYSSLYFWVELKYILIKTTTNWTRRRLGGGGRQTAGGHRSAPWLLPQRCEQRGATTGLSWGPVPRACPSGCGSRETERAQEGRLRGCQRAPCGTPQPGPPGPCQFQTCWGLGGLGRRTEPSPHARNQAAAHVGSVGSSRPEQGSPCGVGTELPRLRQGHLGCPPADF